MIPFSKYHGCGNSFVIVDYEEVKNVDLSKLALNLCNAEIGIGADGLIVVKQPLEMVFYNQDGSRAPMCGNGIRCFAKYAINKGLTTSDVFDVQTLAGIMKVKVEDGLFEINMGKPFFDRDMLHIKDKVDVQSFLIDEYTIHSVFIGTIHSVLFVDSLEETNTQAIGEMICNHPMFEEKTNVNFVEVVDRSNLKIETYERGVGLTKACGTGCCASFLYANQLNKVEDKVTTHLEYGELYLSYNEENVMMKGPATFVCEGQVHMEENLC